MNHNYKLTGGGIRQWQKIEKHHVYIMFAPDFALKDVKQIMRITSNIVTNISREQECDIRIRRRKS